MVFSQKEHRKNSCSLFLLIASFINVFIINYGIIPTLYSLNYPNPELYSIAFCKLRLYFLHSGLMISRSLIILACMDRCALSSSSQRIRSICQPKVALPIIICVSLAWPIISIHIPILLTIQSGRCSTFGTYSLIYSTYSFLVAGLLPPALMIFFGFNTIRNLHSIHVRVRPINDGTYRIHRRDYNLMIMLLGEVIIYLVSTTPYPIQTLYLAVTSNIMKTTLRLQIESFITYMANSFLIYINSAAPFYVYISTSRTFRQECKRLFIRTRHIVMMTTRLNPTNHATHSLPLQQQQQITNHI
ncbi:unnamed protein product [Adineta steineri]|uniref:G-protein coupled receptors family 1 profile domain-containing protein n=1 Tax=Adineta steineri TaxID=433720 RepID=A0A813TSQ5_9BILA|nr:unnamed protein product [Adineta steineri]CAF3672332.1 unnamed protein product [Adineta steineri]